MSESATEGWQRELASRLGTVTGRVGNYEPGDDLRDLLPEQLGVSGGENFSAEDHRGREVLELLQNATDATGRGEQALNGTTSEPSRSVFITITEDGILVANTGENFDFNDGDVRNALRILGHSNKDAETIGEFGVGLTAIRAAGEAYEVWTKADAETASDELTPDDCWRVRCGPENVLAAIAQFADSAAGTRTLSEIRSDTRGATGVLDRGTNDTPIEFDLKPDEFPYFLYPVAATDWLTRVTEGEPSHLRARAHQLLRGDTGSVQSTLPDCVRDNLPSEESFTTAVFVEFENEAWRELYTALGGEELGPRNDHAERLAAQAWFDDREQSEITPELLLNLGGVDTVVVEDRVRSGGQESSYQVWNIDASDSRSEAGREDQRHINRGNREEAVTGKRVTACVSTIVADSAALPEPSGENTSEEFWDSQEPYEFWEFQFSEGQTYGEVDWIDLETTDTGEGGVPDSEIEVSVLVPVDGNRRAYRPHLYYPISGADPEFPFCPHGDFAVQQNRQYLASADLQRNCAVAAELARLVGRVASVLARSEAVDADLRRAIPWQLLPAAVEDEELDRTPESVAGEAETAGRNAPLTALRVATFRALRRSECLPGLGTDDLVSLKDSGSPPLLHESDSIAAGIVALYALDESCSGSANLRTTAAESPVTLLPPESIRELVAWLGEDGRDGNEDWPGLVRAVRGAPAHRTERYRRFIGWRDTEESRVDLQRWSTVLSAWAADLRTDHLSETQHALPGIDEAVAHALLDGTMELAGLSSDSDEVDTAVLNRLVAEADSWQRNPFLLPCGRPTDNSGEDGAADGSGEITLVSIESHASRADKTRRQVLRPVDGGLAAEVPEDTTFNLYFLTERAHSSWGTDIGGANWGTRPFRGITDFYRSLIKDIAKPDRTATFTDIQFLASRYSDINTERGRELAPIEGSYHHRELIDDLVSQRSDISDNYRTRLDARRTELPATVLSGDRPRQGLRVQFGPETIATWLATEETEVPGIRPGLTVPTHLGDGTVEVPPEIEDPGAVLNTLSLFGVSVLPGIRVLTLYGDDAYPSRSNADWDPTGDGWTTKAEKHTRPARLRGVLKAGASPHPYLEHVTAPGFDPVASASHTPNCSVREYASSRTDLTSLDVMLATWTWIEPDVLERMSAGDVAAVLELGGEPLAESVLRTGWSCKDGRGNSSSIDQYVPTLLSWQLSGVEGWEHAESSSFVPPRSYRGEGANGWDGGTGGWTLRYAILDGTADPERPSGQKSAGFLPRVNPNTSELPASVFRHLGVTELEDLNPAQAALRLNEVQNQYSSDESPTPVLFDGQTPRGWRALYGRLLRPILAATTDEDRELTLDDFEQLDRIPAQGWHNGQPAWFALDTDDIADLAVYYETDERTWENRVRTLEEGTYLLRRPDSEYAPTNQFQTLCERMDATLSQATYPLLPDGVTTREASELREQLGTERIKHGVLAAAPAHLELAETKRKYERAVASLRKFSADTETQTVEVGWAFEPRTRGGVALERVTDTEATQFAPVVSNRLSSGAGETRPSDLAELFQALFDGGQIDSYRLALAGGRVEGVDRIRDQLVARDRRKLHEDLELAGRLVNLPPGNKVGTLPEEANYDALRRWFVAGLNSTTEETTPENEQLPENLSEYLHGLRAQAPQPACEWVGEWLGSDRTRAERIRLAEILYPSEGLQAERVAGWVGTVLKRLEKEGRLEMYLPAESSDVYRLAELTTALQQRSTVDDADLRNVRADPSWAKAVQLSLPSGDGEPPTAVFDEVPDRFTWFHLAWHTQRTGTRLTETDVYDAFEREIVDRVSDDDERERISTLLRRRVLGQLSNHRSGNGSDDVDLIETLDGGLPDATGAIGGGLTTVSATGRNGAGGYTGSTTASPRVAELVVLRNAYEALQDSGLDRRDAQEKIEGLQDGGNYWHTGPGWDEVAATIGEGYPDFDNLESLDGTFPGEALDTADEPRVGFDVLDPTGAILGRQSEEDLAESNFNPVPVEVKSVGSLADPGFKLSVNQFRRALAFVAGPGPNRPYVIALVDIRGDADTGYSCEGFERLVMRTPQDLYDLLPGDIQTDSEEGAIAETLLTELVRSGHFVIS